MLGDDLTVALPELQAQAESMMVTACTVRRPTGSEPDPLTGVDTPNLGAAIYTGGCRVQVRNMLARAAQGAELTVPVSSLEVHLPAAAGPFRIGDVVQILDGSTVVRQLRMVGTHVETFQTAQRIPVEETT